MSVEEVERIMEEIQKLAESADTLPLMADLDTAIMYLRHARRRLLGGTPRS